MSSLDSEYNKNKFRFSNRVANIETLLMAFNQLKKKNGNISEEKLRQISSEIKEGKYVFKPLSSYKIPKTSVKLNKGMVDRHTRDLSAKEKNKIF